MTWFTLIAVVGIALVFDFTNGFHDTANAIATVVSTRALPPKVAVLMAAAFNFAGAFAGLKVAATIAKGIVNADLISQESGAKVILAALVGAITWNLITWYFGLPSSSSHALIGGMIGAMVGRHGLHASGMSSIQWHGLTEKVLKPSLLGPLLAIPIALILTAIFLTLFGRHAPGPVNRGFRRLQPLSSGWLAFAHGSNDAQKTMGIILLALIVSPATHYPADSKVPLWVIISAASAMALGTYAGGWRIIRTLGQRIAKIQPPQGFAAELTGGSILWATAHYGFPVSTTHTISGAVLGAGAGGSTRLSAVRWGVAGNILVAWLLTIPCAAVVGAGVELVTRLPGGTFYAVAIAITVLFTAFQGRRKHAAPAAAPVPA
ncbi:MAG: inorganic phosphate transporter, PiT family [Gaiellaceae bacterium]|nr:inorganic phosphate transporter, PiT family [Gaiellaceae bacterium]